MDEPALLYAIGAILIPIIAMIVAMQRQLGSKLSRREHADLCTSARERTEEKLDTLIDRIDRNYGERREQEQRTQDALGEIKAQVAVINDRLDIPGRR